MHVDAGERSRQQQYGNPERGERRAQAQQAVLAHPARAARLQQQHDEEAGQDEESGHPESMDDADQIVRNLGSLVVAPWQHGRADDVNCADVQHDSQPHQDAAQIVEGVQASRCVGVHSGASSGASLRFTRAIHPPGAEVIASSSASPLAQ